jgi:hypothetical protein
MNEMSVAIERLRLAVRTLPGRTSHATSPVADEEAHVLLFEPASTLNTGNVQNERTVAQLDRI